MRPTSSLHRIQRSPQIEGIDMKTLAATAVICFTLTLGAGVDDPTVTGGSLTATGTNVTSTKYQPPETNHTDWRTGCFIFFC